MNKFIKMKNSYAKGIGKGIASKDINGETITYQTRSIWFSKEKLEYLLSQTDELEGGIRIFFGQYDQDTVPEEFSHIKEELVGRLTVVLASCKKDELPKPENFLNGGDLCPPGCPDDSIHEISYKFENAELI